MEGKLGEGDAMTTRAELLASLARGEVHLHHVIYVKGPGKPRYRRWLWAELPRRDFCGTAKCIHIEAPETRSPS